MSDPVKLNNPLIQLVLFCSLLTAMASVQTTANAGWQLKQELEDATRTDNATIERVVDFAGLPVFQGATVRTIVLLTTRPRQEKQDTFYSCIT